MGIPLKVKIVVEKPNVHKPKTSNSSDKGAQRTDAFGRKKARKLNDRASSCFKLGQKKINNPNCMKVGLLMTEKNLNRQTNRQDSSIDERRNQKCTILLDFCYRKLADNMCHMLGKSITCCLELILS